MEFDVKLSWIGIIGADITADAVRFQFGEAIKAKAKSIYVEMSSAGGSVSEALEIVHLVKSMQEEHGIEMQCNIVGECASAATVVLAAFKRRSATYATFLFHEVWMWSEGNVNLTMSKQQFNMLKAFTEEIARIYMEGYGFDKKLALKLLEGETVLSTNEAYALGILNAEPARIAKDVVYNLVKNDIEFVKKLIDKTNQKEGGSKMRKAKFNLKKVKVKGEVRRAVFALDVETDGGLLIILADNLDEAVGAAAMLEDGSPADGEYRTNDGYVITVAEGIVTDVQKEEEPIEADIVEPSSEVENKQEKPFGDGVRFEKKVNAKAKADIKAEVLKRLGLN